MKHKSDIFVSVNPNSPRKRRRRKLSSGHGQIIHFGAASTNTALDSLGSAHIPDENRPLNAMLGSPWTPIPDFRPWDPSKRTGTNLLTPSTASAPTPSDPMDNNSFTSYALGDYEIPEDLPCVEPESIPLLLKLRNTSNNMGRTLEATQSRLHTPSLTPRSAWRDCKQDVLKMISDASRSPLDLILDILDPSQDKHELYRSRWFSPARHSKLSDLLDSIFAHPKGQDLILQWMKPHALDFICSTVASEMDLVTKELSLPSVEHVSPAFISNWSLESVIEPAIRLCPSLIRILEAAAQTGEAKQKNKIKLPKTVRRYLCFSYTLTKNVARSAM